jgi:hypothetical protein
MKVFLIVAALFGSVAVMNALPDKPVTPEVLVEHPPLISDRDAYIAKLTALGFTEQAHPEPTPHSKHHHWPRRGRHHFKHHHKGH